MLTYVLFVIGFVLLIKGADFLVDGASAIAWRMKIQPIVISLTVVAFGTSLPEFIVNVFASQLGTSDLAIGNILGSNIANVLLILGVSSLIYPLIAKSNTVWKEVPLSLLAAVVLALMVSDLRIDGGTVSILSRIDGMILLSIFAIFLYYLFGIARADDSDASDTVIRDLSKGKSAMFIVAGLAGLILGGKWIVDGAIEISRHLGISEGLIGLTIVAVGTSLPELATSAVAAYKKQSDIAIGNIVGSNIFNGLWILGCSALIKPLHFKPENEPDIIMNIAVGLLLFAVMFIGRKHVIERWQGALFIVLYIVYIAYSVWVRQG